ncbi:MAG: orotidine-5'-phosphate decarboxylase [Chloroflexota bacterium]
MESFFSFLEKRVDDCSSLLCVGLDPHVSDLPGPSAASARDFCLNLVKKTAPYAAAFKPNAAFFEVFGADGWTALKQVIEGVQEQSNRLGSMIPVILDAKRGDIASTAEAYAKSAFENLGVHAITLSPYLGRDSIEPFIQNQEKGVFLLCKTSNPGAGDLQDLIVVGADPRVRPNEGDNIKGDPTGSPLHIHVARLAQQWNTKNNIGLVVGATYPETLARVREAAPGLWFLVPGVGAQGGDLESALRAGLREDGKGTLINVSRAISRAANPGLAAAEIRDQILQIRMQMGHGERG